MKLTKIKETPIGGIYIIPVINVAFVLVVVLMIIAPIVNIPTIPVELPEAVTKEAKEQNITISYSKDERIAVDTEEVTWRRLAYKLRQKLGRRKNVYFIIRADKNIPFGKVERILELLVKKVGAKNIAVATKQKVSR